MANSYTPLNLQFNPFGSQNWATRAETAVPSLPLEPLVEWLRQPGRTVQFLGRSGSGKSTHLAALNRHFPEAPFIYIRQNEPVRLPSALMVFVDECQRIPVGQRWQMWRSEVTYVVGTHWHHAPECALAGRPFRTRWLRGLSAEQLVAIANRRIEIAVSDPSRPTVQLSAVSARKYIQKHGSDVRSICDDLYDVIESLETVRSL